MKGQATSGGAKQPTDRPMERPLSHFMKVPLAVALLSDHHGEAEARKVALTEQRRAKRARSKKRFAFWADVAARIENGNSNNAANTGRPDREGPASRL